MRVDSWEANMAAITLDTAHQAGARFDAVLTALREMLDAFVSYRMRLAAAQAEHVRPWCLSRR
jgi:hypothetical protein